MTISRKAKIRGGPGLTLPDRRDTFPAHDERMRRFRQNHGGNAGVEITAIMGIRLYVMPSIKDYGGSTGFLRTIGLPQLILMRRPPLSLFSGN